MVREGTALAVPVRASKMRALAPEVACLSHVGAAALGFRPGGARQLHKLAAWIRHALKGRGFQPRRLKQSRCGLQPLRSLAALMWGQPPSAVRPGKARQLPAATATL